MEFAQEFQLVAMIGGTPRPQCGRRIASGELAHQAHFLTNAQRARGNRGNRQVGR